MQSVSTIGYELQFNFSNNNFQLFRSVKSYSFFFFVTVARYPSLPSFPLPPSFFPRADYEGRDGRNGNSRKTRRMFAGRVCCRVTSTSNPANRSWD